MWGPGKLKTGRSVHGGDGGVPHRAGFITTASPSGPAGQTGAGRWSRTGEGDGGKNGVRSSSALTRERNRERVFSDTEQGERPAVPAGDSPCDPAVSTIGDSTPEVSPGTAGSTHPVEICRVEVSRRFQHGPPCRPGRRLVQSSGSRTSRRWIPSGRRYVPAAGGRHTSFISRSSVVQ